MSTSSADPERLLDLHDRARRAAGPAGDQIDAVGRARRSIGPATLDRHGATEAVAGAALQQVEHLARSVAQVAESFLRADRGTVAFDPSSPTTTPGPMTISSTAPAEAIELVAPGLSSGALGSPVRQAQQAGGRAADALRRSIAAHDADAAAVALAHLGAVGDGDPVRSRHASSAMLARLDADDIEALVALLCEHEWANGDQPALDDLSEAIGAAVGGPAPGAAQHLVGLVADLATTVGGRNALRVLASTGLRLSPPLAAQIATVLLLRSDARSDLGQGPDLAMGTDLVSLWLTARHADGDEPALALLAATPGAAERFLGRSAATVTERVERLLHVADRPGAQRVLAPIVAELVTAPSTFDAEGTVSARGRAVLRGLVQGTTDPTAVSAPLAAALATAVGAHPDGYEALASGPPADRASLDRHLQAVTAHRWPTVVLLAGLMERRRQTMAATLTASFEHRSHALVPGARLHAAVERAGAATDQVEVDTTVHAVARALVPAAARSATAALGGGPVAATGVLLAQLAATSWIDDQRDRRRTSARPEPVVPMVEAARSQLRIDAWRAIAHDPELGALVARRGQPGDPTVDGGPLPPDPDALAEWEQAQPAATRDLVETFAAALAPSVPG